MRAWAAETISYDQAMRLVQELPNTYEPPTEWDMVETLNRVGIAVIDADGFAVKATAHRGREFYELVSGGHTAVGEPRRK